MLFRVCTALPSIYLDTSSPDMGWWIHLTAYKNFNFTYLDQWLSSELMEKLTHRILKTHRKQISALAATLTHGVVTPQLWQSPDYCLELHLIRNNVIVVSVCLPSDSVSQRLPSYWCLLYPGHGVSLHGFSSKVQLLLLTLDIGHLLAAAGCSSAAQPPLASPAIREPVNFQMFKLVLEKAEKPEIKLPTSAGSSKKAREFQKNIYFCFMDYAKAFDFVKWKWSRSVVFNSLRLHGL